ncbi:carbohydrate ABC transporter permease [Petrocella sp. FN5]|uniref:carbohydrate ABC transporter permease n=1 Tax=Petrocella sp. FN5 TaxID=3032002 RepID=UPI0023DB4DB2|nr:sugar ABC transporter permease [Petrocella sp. FN5]MDF1617257.1 sugar ABC transporter permease [Petrocella sp. FN5]
MKKSMKRKLIFWGFLGPSLIAFTIVVLVPFVVGIYYSFTDWNAVPGSTIHFVGLVNYKNVFNDPQLIRAFRNTFIYSFYAVFLINTIGFLLALLVTQKMRSANLLRTVFFMPNLIGGLILGYVWKFLFLKIVPNIFQTDGNMLSKPSTALIAMAIVATWQMGGYIMVIYVAAIQGIPSELLEASKIDGANSWQNIKSIIFPLVAPAFTVSMFLTLRSAFMIYDVNVSLTNGDPIRSTELIAMGILSKAYKELNFAQGQVQAILFFVVVASVSMIQVYYSKKREVEM